MQRIVLAPEQHATLYRAVQAGARRAGQGLEEMIGRPVTATIRNVDLVPLGDVAGYVGDIETPITAVHLGITDDLSGHLLLLLVDEAAYGLADLLLDQPPGTTTEIGEMEQSALQEAGNITGSFFLTALAEATGLTIQPTPPGFAQDMCGSILDGPLSMLAMYGDDALLIETEFRQEDRHIQGLLLMLPDQPSLAKFLGRLG